MLTRSPRCINSTSCYAHAGYQTTLPCLPSPLSLLTIPNIQYSFSGPYPAFVLTRAISSSISSSPTIARFCPSPRRSSVRFSSERNVRGTFFHGIVRKPFRFPPLIRSLMTTLEARARPSSRGCDYRPAARSRGWITIMFVASFASEIPFG